MRRRWLSSRAITFHLLLLVLAPGCLIAGWWQVHRAMAGNLLSYAYSVEWPAFAVIAVIGWWQLIQEDPADVRARHAERVHRAQLQEAAATEDPAMWAIGLRRASELGRAPGAFDPVAIAARSEQTADGSAVALPDPDADEDVEAATLEAVTAYDQYLRRLAASNRPKSWRRPQGIPAPPAGPDRPGAEPDGSVPRTVIDVEGVVLAPAEHGP